MRNWITTGARLLMALLFTATGLWADDSQPGRSVITKDQVNHYQLSDSEWIIRFDQGLSQAAKDQILDGISYVQRVEHLRSPEISLIKVTPGVPEATLQQLFNAQAGIRYAARGLVYGDGTREFPLDRVFVQLHSAAQLPILQQQAASLGMQVLEESFMENLYELALDKNSQLEPIAFSNQLNAYSNYDWAEPDMLRLMKKLSTNDTFIGSQWSLENTGTYFGGTPGEDMSVFGAWTTTTGSSSIKVAIIDEGVDLNHPDLVGNMLAGFDGHGITAGDAENDDAHGTACAGIVAAVGNNSLGTAGIAYGSKIIPVRIAYSNIDGDWVTSNSIIGNCITWSWQTAGADVLSNSWGGGGSSSLINGPITNAVTLGRGGLGSPVLFAAGNSNTSMIYPATQPDVISVAAMSMCGERKTPTSCDGEYWWGSCFGAGLDVAAPGVKIYTSDIAGADGYSSGDYAPTFNGTSSATPNAAGVMALVLSANPALTEAQARAILETTCDKAGGYTYATDPSYPNGTRCDDLGYGRVNAAAAVLAATGGSSTCDIDGTVGTTTVGSTSATVYFSGTASSATGYIVEYGLSGFTLGTGSTANSVDTTIVLTGLSANTAYDFYIFADCSGTPSDSSEQGSFTTLCGEITSFPFVEDFEAASTTASCWTNEYVVGSSNWTIGTGASGGSITTAYSGTNNARFVSQFGSATPVTKLVSPVMDLSGMTAPRMSFYYGQQEWFGDQNELKVYYRVSAGDPWVQISHYTGNIGAWTFELLNLPSPSATYQIAFEGINYYGYRNVIDLVTIEETPSCPTPYALGSFNITDITADIYWNGGAATGWNIEYGPAGYTFGSGTSATSGNDTTTLTGLTAATTYDVYVQGDCGGAWAGPYSFTTGLCSAASQCNYTITMTDSYGDGWNGNVIGFRQGGVVVATAGSSFTTGSGPVSLNIPLCDLQSTEIFVSTLGSYSEEVGFTVTDPFGIDVFTRAPGSSFASGQVLATFTSNCTPPACAIPTNLTKTFTSSTSVDFNWVAGGSETEWEVAIVSAGSAVPTSGTTVTSAMYSASGLMADSSYTFYVRANCGSATSNWVTMDVNLFHCIPNPSSVDGQGIVNVAFGTINNASGAEPGNYGDYSNLSTDIGQTTNVTVSITFATGYTYDTKIWIDWNDDYDFDDAGEEVYSGTSLSTNPTTLAASFVVPSNAPLGQHRMRIGSQDFGPPVPCYTGAYGSYEDYSVNVTAPPSCTAPLSITASGVTPTEATLSWLSSSSSSDYVIQYGLSGFGLGSGTMVAVNGDTTTTLSGLTDNTSYQAYVQTNCGSDSSAWTGPVSFTTLCIAASMPYSEDFDSWPPSCWDLDNGSVVVGQAFGGDYMEGNFWTWSTGNVGLASSQAVDITANAEVSFRWAHKYEPTYPNDQVLLLVRAVGAATWDTISNLAGATFDSPGAQNSAPPADSAFVTETIALDASYVGQTVEFRFDLISGWGPDVYIDDFSVAEPVPTCNTAYNPMAEVISNYTVEFSWSDMGHGTYNLHLRNVGDTAWTTLLASDTSRVLENRAPGDYQFYVSAVGGGDASCVGNFSVNCADDITYTYNVFQAPELGRKGRATILNTLGGKRKYNIALVNSNGDTTLQTNRRIGFFTNLDDDTYTIYVSDAYDCLADSVGMFTINSLDTAKIPNLINAPNNSPNGFRPTWNSVDGVINYQLRVLNVTDGTLVNFITGITDTMHAVTGLTPGKLYRFNVRSRYNNGVATVNSGYSNPVSRNLAAGGNKDGEASDLGENASDLISIYPNPVADVLYINAADGSTVALMDLNGKLISAREINGQEVSFDMSHLASGVYMVRITHANHVTIQKVVKQ